MRTEKRACHDLLDAICRDTDRQGAGGVGGVVLMLLLQSIRGFFAH